jgi:hypothetical protein
MLTGILAHACRWTATARQSATHLSSIMTYADRHPDSCLQVDSHWHVKVGDFNLSKILTNANVLSSAQATNPRWLAPEIIEGAPATPESVSGPAGKACPSVPPGGPFLPAIGALVLAPAVIPSNLKQRVCGNWRECAGPGDHTMHPAGMHAGRSTPITACRMALCQVPCVP